jgi:hypothetical protein
MMQPKANPSRLVVVRTYGLRAGLAGVLLLLAQGAEAQQYESGFEPPLYTGSPEGVSVSGQDGWYLPPVGGQDGKVYTYADNVLGFPANPTGGEQFEGGVSDGALFPRAQHDHNFVGSSTEIDFIIGYDTAVKYTGNFPAAANLASFSLQDSTVARFFISLNNFEDPNTATTWKAEFNVYDAAGTPLNNQSPGAAWTGLAVDHWYRLTATVNFHTNRLFHVTITDLTTGDTSEADVPWYLTGGENPVLPRPTAFRCFVGGSAGSTAGYDNVSALLVNNDECYADCTGEGELDFFDFLCFQNAFANVEEYAECTGEGDFDFFDFLCFQNAFAEGC